MSDITACSDKKCPSRILCYRYICEKDTYQSYFAKSPRKKNAVSCSEFWSNAVECRCNLFGMKHKRSSFCDVFEQITMPELIKKDKLGIKSQKYILKEMDKKSKCSPRASTRKGK